MMSRAKLLARIEALEAQFISRIDIRGISIVELLIAAHGVDAEVVALEVGSPPGMRHRVMRRNGESIEALERRANPDGCWRASPSPIFSGDQAETEADEALRLMLNCRARAGLRLLP